MDPRTATAADEALVASTLAAALADDPCFRWIWSTDAEGTMAGNEAWMRLVLERTRGRAEVDVMPDGSAVAIWIHPDRPLVPDDYAALSTMLAGRLGERAAEVMAALAATAPLQPAEPHRTLLYVGVRPEAQGRGAGRDVLAPGLGRADAEGHPVFLNSTNPRNVPFYERLGFAGLGAVTVADGIVIRPMWRSAR